MHTHFTYVLCHHAIEVLSTCTNETPTVRGLAADNSNKLYIETMIFLWNNHYNLIFNVGLSDKSIRNEDEKHDYHAWKIFSTRLEQYHYNYNTVTTITLALQ